jgi:hypothetical protein
LREIRQQYPAVFSSSRISSSSFQSIGLPRHPVASEIGKKLFYVRDGVIRVLHDEFFPLSIRECPGVDNINGSLLMGIMPSDVDCRDFNLLFRSFCRALFQLNCPLALLIVLAVFEKPEEISPWDKKDIVLQILFFKIESEKIPFEEEIGFRRLVKRLQIRAKQPFGLVCEVRRSQGKGGFLYDSFGGRVAVLTHRKDEPILAIPLSYYKM